jgi:uncharacterized protein (TIGR02217 family)
MFLEETFPKCPSFGYTSEPMYSVTVIERSSGVERRNRNWQYPLHRFSCTVGPRAEEDISELLEFYHAVGGSAYGFRFRDGVDYKTSRIESAVTDEDAPLLLVTGYSPASYQLIKRYTYGSRTQDRPIFKPVQGTILIADNGTPKAEGADYTIDYTTGLVELDFTPTGPLTWGGEFDVPVRFDSTFPVELFDRKIQSVAFVLRELRASEV